MKYKIHFVIFVSFLLIFLIGQAQQVTDSRFTILLSHSLYSSFSFNLKPYLDFPSLNETISEVKEKYDHQGQVIESGQLVIKKNNNKNEIWRMKYSPIPSLLSLPFVFILDNLGLSVTNPQTLVWNPTNEIRQQVIIASILCAFYAVVLFSLARLWLPKNLSILITIILVLGSSVASSLSRAIWSDTWGCLLTLLAIHHLAYAHYRYRKINVFYSLLLVILAVFCKPLFLFSAIAIAVWILIIDKKKFIVVNVLTIIGAGIYFIWALRSNDSLVAVYQFTNFNFINFEYFAGILISPSRGILVFSPWIIFILTIFCFLYKKINPTEKRIFLISITPIIGIIILLSTYEFWWAGFAYGPRLQSPMMPWLSVISIILFAKFWEYIKSKNKLAFLDKGLITLGVICSILAILINVYGINQKKAFYQWHLNITYDPKIHENVNAAILARMWNWQDPIFLAGIINQERYLESPSYFQERPNN